MILVPIICMPAENANKTELANQLKEASFKFEKAIEENHEFIELKKLYPELREIKQKLLTLKLLNDNEI